MSRAHIHAQKQAMSAFIQYEAESRISVALRHKPRPVEHFMTGDVVEFRLGNSQYFRGPGVVVIGKDEINRG